MRVIDVAVVGGGLSGAMVANSLLKRSPSLNCLVLEARPVLGGRLQNNRLADNSSDNEIGLIDMGGAWIWPFQQPYMKSLVREHNIPTFPQPDDTSSTRIRGGAVEIVKALMKDNDENVQLNTAVTACTRVRAPNNVGGNEGETLIRLDTNRGESLLARRVVFAAPPRVLHKNVTFDPPLSSRKQQAMASSHTWMAGVTKVALVYKKQFWEEGDSNMGLPQQHGPAFQVYDSSTADGSVAALTFFTLVTPDNTQAQNDDSALAQQVAKQMGTVWDYFGSKDTAKQVHTYTEHYVHRWPRETYISEDERPTIIHPHPHPVRALSEPEWDGLLEFAGSETDRRSPGVMEGAVGAAKRVLQSLESFVSNLPLNRPRETTIATSSETTASCLE